MTTEHLRSAVDAAVGPVKVQVRWQGYAIGLLAAAVFSPKFGGPAPPTIAALPAKTAIAVVTAVRTL